MSKGKIVATLKLGIAQFHSPKLRGSVGFIEELLEKGADLVVLPEKWMHAGDGNVVTGKHPFLEKVAELSERYGASVLTGALMERDGGRRYITCYAFGPDGGMMAKCRKLHPFGLEKRSVDPGTDIAYFDFKGARIGMAICYDMDFPETARGLALAGCDMLAVPTKIRKEGIEPWLIYLQARALENRMPIVFANEVNPPHFTGMSGVIDLLHSKDGMVMYPRMRLMGKSQGSRLYDLDPAKYREDRRKRMADRHEVVDRLHVEDALSADTDKFTLTDYRP